VPLEYDSLLAKLIGYGESREQAVRRLLRAMEEYTIAGIKTNLSYLRQLLDNAEFLRGELHTGFLDEFRSEPAQAAEDTRVAVALAAVSVSTSAREAVNGSASVWLREGRERLLR
jgi:acetyl/propionyl-CoA carboxylase alpha subunit